MGAMSEQAGPMPRKLAVGCARRLWGDRQRWTIWQRPATTLTCGPVLPPSRESIPDFAAREPARACVWRQCLQLLNVCSAALELWALFLKFLPVVRRLHFKHAGVASTEIQKLVVIAVLGNPSVVQNNDAVRHPYRGKPLRYKHSLLPSGHFAE